MNRHPCHGKGDVPGDYFHASFPPCFYCIHLLKSGDLAGNGWTCKAFPDGISYPILMREWDHTKPLPYDNGFQYEVEPFTDRGKRYTILWDGNVEVLEPSGRTPKG